MGVQPQRVGLKPVKSRKIDRQLKGQQEVYPGVISASGLGLVWYNSTGHILGANKPFCAMIGYTQRALMGKRLVDLAVPEEPETQRQLLPKALLGQLGRVACHWRHKTGILIPTQSTFAAFQRSSRGTAISQVLVQNVSDLKEQEAAGNEAFELVNRLEKMCGLGSWSMEIRFKRALHKNPVKVSEGLRRIFGQRAVTATKQGQFFFKAMHREDFPRVLATLRRALVSSKPQVLETRITIGKGKERILEVHAELRKATQGQTAVLVGAVHDITNRKHTESAVCRAKEFFEAVVDALPLNLAILDEQTNVVSVNKAWRKFAKANGFHGEELGLGMNYLQVCENASARNLGEAQMVARALRQMLNGRSNEFTFEYACHSPSEQRWFMLQLSPFTFGGELRIVAAHLKVTRLKQAERSLEEARELLSAHAIELERRIDKRTLELKETIRSLEGVLYHVAHDLRAPLRAIEGFTALLVQDYADNFNQVGRDYADRVTVSAKRMDALIGDLLNFGKVCVVDLPKTFLNLNSIVDSVLKRLWKQIEQSGAEVEVLRPLPKIWANEWALGEALTQLLSNSLKFVRPGAGPRIRIWAQTNNATIRLWIQDNGTGIPSQYVERVFRMFERLDESSGSTGIGLAIVRKAVERMDGLVGAESTPGKGSRFWVELLRSPQMA
jgi:PAS domain S-box-containing protein